MAFAIETIPDIIITVFYLKNIKGKQYMKITKAEMDEKLQHLNEVMKDHVSGPLLKNMLLEMIQENKTDT